MFLSDGWQDYELIDSGNGEKLEALGGYNPAQAGTSGNLADEYYHRIR